MGRGFLGGMIWGALASVIALGILAQLFPLSEQSAPAPSTVVQDTKPQPEPSPEPIPDPVPMPSPGDGAQEPDQVSEPGMTQITAPPRPALEAFAVKTQLSEGAVQLAVILMDDGRANFKPEHLAQFPLKVSFALTPDHPDPATAMAIYRAAGFEVLALADLTDRRAASEALAQVPEAVALMEMPLVQGQVRDRPMKRILSDLSDSGHGLVLQAGFDGEIEDTPVGFVARDLDGEGQTYSAIRDALGAVAKEAGTTDGALVFGRMWHGDTLTALMLWGRQEHDPPVAMLPVSALLGVR